MEQFSGDSCSGGNKCPGGTSLGENCLGGNLLWEIVQKLFRDNFLWGKSPGGNCPGGNFMSSNCPEGRFPGGWGECSNTKKIIAIISKTVTSLCKTVSTY